MKKTTPLPVMVLAYLLAVSAAANLLLYSKLASAQAVASDLSRQVFTLQSQASPALADFRRNLNR